MQDNDDVNNDVLLCPLCGSEEYLLSDKNTMLCGGCGAMIDNVDQFHHDKPVIEHLVLSSGPQLQSPLNH